jgi:lipopolysaccharide transport system ATP-binding protein
MGEALIEVESVSKKFCKDLKKGLWYGLKDMVSAGDSSQLRPDEFWSVQDVSFSVRRGECLGIVGHNGAGKSTLLKMLNGLLKPDKGCIRMRGRVGALIELGAGFNPILTGRENIFNNAAVLGFSKKETEARLAEIVEFSEMEDFLDMPVQHYSSGMQVRLGFAVAAQMEPDILLVDEVLAVGDMGFVLKCFNRMDKLLSNSALILVSHNIPQVARMATQLLVLEKGKVMTHSSDVSQGITDYYDRYQLEIGDYKGSEEVELISVSIGDKGCQANSPSNQVFNYAQPVDIVVVVDFHRPISAPNLYLAFYDREQRNFAEVSNFEFEQPINEVSGRVEFRACLQELLLSQGKFSITIGLGGLVDGNRTILFRYQSALYFTVHSKIHGWAPIQLRPEWKVVQRPA